MPVRDPARPLPVPAGPFRALHRRRRRRIRGSISVVIAVTAIAVALHLGLTGPTTSPLSVVPLGGSGALPTADPVPAR